MKLVQFRLFSTKEETISALYLDQPGKVREFICWILEDQFQEGGKVYGETRIPAGNYKLVLRQFGRLYNIYAREYEEFKPGMIELQGVKNFTDILIHPGNDDDDTLGCLIPGENVIKQKDGYIVKNSTLATLDLYRLVTPEISKGVYLEIIDFDREANK